MAASLLILALCASAGEADRWLEEHEPGADGNWEPGSAEHSTFNIQRPTPNGRPRPGQLTNAFHNLNQRPKA
jgi:hypothetical protein